MTEAYTPDRLARARDLRDRDDVMWEIDKAVEAWEVRERILAQQIERNGRFVASEKALYDEVVALRQRLEAAVETLREIADCGENQCRVCKRDAALAAGETYPSDAACTRHLGEPWPCPRCAAGEKT